jgi:hypothetical protein
MIAGYSASMRRNSLLFFREIHPQFLFFDLITPSYRPDMMQWREQSVLRCNTERSSRRQGSKFHFFDSVFTLPLHQQRSVKAVEPTC